MPVQIVCENLSQISTSVSFIHVLKTSFRPGLRIALNNERAGILIEFVGMRSKHSRLILSERECKSMEKLIGAVPDILVGTNVQRWLEMVLVLFTDRAVDTVRANQQVARAG